MYKGYRVAVVIPAQNEEGAIAKVIAGLWRLRLGNESNIIDDIVVCDNGSTDNTALYAGQSGAIVVYQPTPGYGIACLTAIAQLPECDIVLFVDGDDSCFIPQALTLLEGIAQGDDVAIGSRNLGEIEPGALTIPQRFGNWLSAKLIFIFWGYRLTDLGPFRAIRFSTLKELHMQDKTFGWTVEMQVKAIIQKKIMHEYPVNSKVRIGTSKISGTIKGSIKAGIGILSMIAKLRFSK
jgi:glycosyltransferase involved in cell wall biosynthesis